MSVERRARLEAQLAELQRLAVELDAAEPGGAGGCQQFEAVTDPVARLELEGALLRDRRVHMQEKQLNVLAQGVIALQLELLVVVQRLDALERRNDTTS